MLLTWFATINIVPVIKYSIIKVTQNARQKYQSNKCI